MFSIAGSKVQLYIYSIFVFILLPFITTGATIDPEVTLRFLLTAVILVSGSVYLLFSKKESIVFHKNTFSIFGVACLIIAWMAFCIIRSVNSGDAFTELCRLSVLYGLFLLFYVFLIGNPGFEKQICRASAFAVLAFSTFGFLQIYSSIVATVTTKNIVFANLVSSTLTNKNFFSEALCLSLPFLIYGLGNDRRWWKALFIVALLTNLMFIFLLETLAVWIAILIAIVFWFTISIRYGNFKISIKRKFIYLFFTISIVLAVLFFKLYKSTSAYELTASKFKRAWEYMLNPELISETRIENNNSVFERLMIWRNSVRMIGDHPLFGAGLNNWKIYNPKYGIGGTQFSNTGMLNFEHPHNDYLLIWAEQGLVGIVLYILFFVLIIRAGIKNMKRGSVEMKKFTALLLSGVIAFATISLFAYPRSRFYTMILLMIIFALILSINKDERQGKVSSLPVGLLLLLISICGTVSAFYRLKGEIYIKNTIFAQLDKNFPRMIREADKAGSWFFPLDNTATPVSWYKGMSKFYSNDVKGAIEEYEKAILVNPYHLRVLNDLATCYEQTGERTKAIQFYRMTLNITPQFIEGNLNISAAYYNINRIDSAFYFIDRIYALPRSMGEESNYVKFLDAILYAKIYDEAQLLSDTVSRNEIIRTLEDKERTRKLYFNVKDTKSSFDVSVFESNHAGNAR